MSNKVIYLMLLHEIKPLKGLAWFEPVGSKIDILFQLVADDSSEGLTKKEVGFLRDCAKRASNLAISVIEFLSLMRYATNELTSDIEGIERSKIAIEKLIWNILIDIPITSYYIAIIEQIWYQYMGYKCPYDFGE